MPAKRDILLTFDYELYLGTESGSAEKCILQPTNALRKILNKHNAKAIFFIDILYLLNLKKHNELLKDFDAIKKQLKTLFEEGHYIFPHIHPHWLDAIYLEKEKQFLLTNLSAFSLAKFEKPYIKQLFKESISFLKEIGISYSDWGYRAGGWCIQPFSLFKDVFVEEKITYEFSVLPGYKNDNPSQAFDFTKVTTQNPYYFLNEVENVNENGIFIEFPISTIEFNKVDLLKDRVVKKYLWETNDRGWGNGISAQTTALKSEFINREMISIDILTIAKLSQYKKHISNENYMHWISHPKMFTRHGLKTFDKFLKFSTTNFDLVFDFKKMIPEKL